MSIIVTLIMKVLRNTMLIFWILVLLVVTISEASQHSASRYQVEKTPISNSAYLTKPFFREKRNVKLVPVENACVLQGQQLQDETKASAFRYEFAICKFREECKKDWQTEFEQWKSEQEKMEQEDIKQTRIQNLSSSNRLQYFQGKANSILKRLISMQKNRLHQMDEKFDSLIERMYNREVGLDSTFGKVELNLQKKISIKDHNRILNTAYSQMHTLLAYRENFEKEELEKFVIKTFQTINPLVRKPTANSASGCNLDYVRSVLPQNVFVLLLASAIFFIGAANVL